MKCSGMVVALLLLAGFVLPLVMLAPASNVSSATMAAGIAYDSGKGEVFLLGEAHGLDSKVPVVSNTPNSVVTTVTMGFSGVVGVSQSPSVSNLLPSSLAPYASIIATILIFADGVIFGVAIKKAILSAVMVIAGLLLAGFVGLTLPLPSTSSLLTLLTNTLTSQAQAVGPVIYALPIFWIIGLAIGFWKG